MFSLRVELFLQGVVLVSIVLLMVELQLEDPGPVWWYLDLIVVSIFSVEYVLRLARSRPPWKYGFSFLGIVDLLAILPFFLTFMGDLRALRLLRLLRIVRALKLQRLNESLSRFLFSFGKIGTELKVIGTLLFFVLFVSSIAVFEAERRAQPEAFGDFASSYWWAIVTMTTVGYGDQVPITIFGRIAAGFTVIVGLIAFGVFTSVVGTAFLTTIQRNSVDITQTSRERLDRLVELTGMHEQRIVDEALGYLEIIYDVENRLSPQPFVQFDTSEQVCQRSL